MNEKKIPLLITGGMPEYLMDRILTDGYEMKHIENPSDEELAAAEVIVGFPPVSRLITADSAQVTYIVFDKANNMTTLTRTVRYSDYEKPKFSMNGPLNYTQEDTITLLDRLTAQDLLHGDLSQNICVISQNVSQEPGTYSVTVQVTNPLGDTSTLPLKLVIGRAGTKQLITLTDYLVYLEKGAFFDPNAYIGSVRDPDGEALAHSAVTVEGYVDTDRAGVYHVRYSCAAQDQIYHVYLTVVVE